MNWNYRILKYANDEYGLHEVHYDEHGKSRAVTKEPMIEGSSPQDIVDELERALDDAKNCIDDNIPMVPKGYGFSPEARKGAYARKFH
jgi:hypothetical protein